MAQIQDLIDFSNAAFQGQLYDRLYVDYEDLLEIFGYPSIIDDSNSTGIWHLRLADGVSAFIHEVRRPTGFGFSCFWVVRGRTAEVLNNIIARVYERYADLD